MEGYYYFRQPGDCPKEMGMGYRRKENCYFASTARAELPRLIDKVRQGEVWEGVVAVLLNKYEGVQITEELLQAVTSEVSKNSGYKKEERGDE